MEIRQLRESDDRSTFRSGDIELDRFFARYAGQNQFRHHLGVTYVAVEGSGIRGYATVAPGNVEGEHLPAVIRRRVPRYPIPVLRLARLAVAESARSAGLGSALLRHVFIMALKMSGDFGCAGVVVDVKPAALEFYKRFGFSPLEVTAGRLETRPESTAMFLPLELIARAALSPHR